jgi:hypothetical protein
MYAMGGGEEVQFGVVELMTISHCMDARGWTQEAN